MRLRLGFEDPVGSHLPDEVSVPDGPEEIGLAQFERCLLAADDLDATIMLETGTAADGRGFDRVLARSLPIATHFADALPISRSLDTSSRGFAAALTCRLAFPRRACRAPDDRASPWNA